MEANHCFHILYLHRVCHYFHTFLPPGMFINFTTIWEISGDSNKLGHLPDKDTQDLGLWIVALIVNAQ